MFPPTLTPVMPNGIAMCRYGGEKSAKEAPITHTVEDLFFAQQMVTNACATQALVNSAFALASGRTVRKC